MFDGIYNYGCQLLVVGIFFKNVCYILLICQRDNVYQDIKSRNVFWYIKKFIIENVINEMFYFFLVSKSSKYDGYIQQIGELNIWGRK